MASPLKDQGAVVLVRDVTAAKQVDRMKSEFTALVSHELRSIFAIADRLLLLDAARKTQVAIGPPHELRDASADPWVRRFLSPAEAA